MNKYLYFIYNNNYLKEKTMNQTWMLSELAKKLPIYHVYSSHLDHRANHISNYP